MPNPNQKVFRSPYPELDACRLLHLVGRLWESNLGQVLLPNRVTPVPRFVNSARVSECAATCAMRRPNPNPLWGLVQTAISLNLGCMQPPKP